MKRYLEFNEPIKGIDKSGQEVVCNRRVRMTVEDAVMMERNVLVHVLGALSEAKALTVDDKILLEEFKAVHWATEVIE